MFTFVDVDDQMQCDAVVAGSIHIMHLPWLHPVGEIWVVFSKFNPLFISTSGTAELYALSYHIGPS